MPDEQMDCISELGLDNDLASISGLPAALAKAIDDRFQYALMLRDGTIIEFESASLSSTTGWVLLDGPRVVNRGYDACLERGIEVRLSEIAWVADAPNGS